MTAMQERAMDLIQRMPEEKIYYLINLLEGLVETTPLYKNEPTNAQKAYQNLQKFRRRGTEDRDYKTELYAALEERYESIE